LVALGALGYPLLPVSGKPHIGLLAVARLLALRADAVSGALLSQER
jgi:hypothetical protein